MDASLKAYTNDMTETLREDLGAAATSIGELVSIMNDQLLVGRPDAACEIAGVDLYMSRLKADRLSELGHLIAATLDEILTSERMPEHNVVPNRKPLTLPNNLTTWLRTTEEPTQEERLSGYRGDMHKCELWDAVQQELILRNLQEEPTGTLDF